jgi:predicted metal-dependent hydrolase
LMQVTGNKTFVQKMKTRWGSCNYRAHHIRLNSDLASYPPHCLEYVVVHELVHLLEPSHNTRFYALMTQFYPDWPAVRAQLRHGDAC